MAFQPYYKKLERWRTTYTNEIVPDSLKFPHVIARNLGLKYLREQSYEMRRAEERTVDTLILEMSVKIR